MQKEEILRLVKAKVDERISSLEHLIDEARASNNDTKSSMGDKYETGREMLQQVINQYQGQLSEIRAQKDILEHINSEPCEKVQNGVLVKTDKGLFYISVSLGEILYEGLKIFTVSKDAPLVKAMMGKAQNETFVMPSGNHSILQIW